MKSVLISIQPKWCELIANGEKTIEVRKTKPKLETPFKCYIYCTKDKNFTFLTDNGFQYTHIGNGKVIGEFVCDRINFVRNYGDMVDSYDCIASCLSAHEIIEYAKDKNGNFVYTYGWHISNLVIYDKPRELSEFHHLCKQPSGTDCSKCLEEGKTTCWSITRPPQSWCYVESEVDTE
jgi:predicted transcriptional regulator